MKICAPQHPPSSTRSQRPSTSSALYELWASTLTLDREKGTSAFPMDPSAGPRFSHKCAGAHQSRAGRAANPFNNPLDGSPDDGHQDMYRAIPAGPALLLAATAAGARPAARVGAARRPEGHRVAESFDIPLATAKTCTRDAPESLRGTQLEDDL
jgi:hypothetical protein